MLTKAGLHLVATGCVPRPQGGVLTQLVAELGLRVDRGAGPFLYPVTVSLTG